MDIQATVGVPRPRLCHQAGVSQRVPRAHMPLDTLLLGYRLRGRRSHIEEASCPLRCHEVPGGSHRTEQDQGAAPHRYLQAIQTAQLHLEQANVKARPGPKRVRDESVN